MTLKRDCKKRKSLKLYITGRKQKNRFLRWPIRAASIQPNPFLVSSCPPYSYPTNQSASIHLTLPRSRLHRGSPTLCSICRVCFFFRVIMHAGRAFAAGLVKRRKGGVHLSPLLSVHQNAFRFSVAINPFNNHPLNG